MERAADYGADGIDGDKLDEIDDDEPVFETLVSDAEDDEEPEFSVDEDGHELSDPIIEGYDPDDVAEDNAGDVFEVFSGSGESVTDPAQLISTSTQAATKKLRSYLELDATSDELQLLEEEGFFETLVVMQDEECMQGAAADGATSANAKRGIEEVEPSPVITEIEVMGMKVDQLKEHLKKFNQRLTGNKIELQERLKLYLRNPEDPNNPNIDKRGIKKRWYAALHTFIFLLSLKNLRFSYINPL